MATECCCPRKNIQSATATLWMFDLNTGRIQLFRDLGARLATAPDVHVAFEDSVVQWGPSTFGVAPSYFKLFRNRQEVFDASGPFPDLSVRSPVNGDLQFASGGSNTNPLGFFVNATRLFVLGNIGTAVTRVWVQGFAGADDDHAQWSVLGLDGVQRLVEYDAMGLQTQISTGYASRVARVIDQSGYIAKAGFFGAAYFVPRDNFAARTTVSIRGVIPLEADAEKIFSLSGANQLFADSYAGDPLWTDATLTPLVNSSHNHGATGLSPDGSVFVIYGARGGDSPKLHGYDAATGTHLWERSGAGASTLRLNAIGTDFIINSSAATLSRIRFADGAAVWTRDYTQSVPGLDFVWMSVDSNRIWCSGDATFENLFIE